MERKASQSFSLFLTEITPQFPKNSSKKVPIKMLTKVPQKTVLFQATEIKDPVSYTHLDVYKRQILCWYLESLKSPSVSLRKLKILENFPSSGE